MSGGAGKRVSMLAAVVVALTAAAAAPAPAAAKQSINFTLRAGNDYRAFFSASERRASVRIVRSSRFGNEMAYYEARGDSTLSERGRFHADFGSFGSIRGRYTGDEKGGECLDGAPKGRVRGRFTFRGEDGYARVSARRAPAHLGSYTCTVGERAQLRAPSRKETLLLACRGEDRLLYAAIDVGKREYHYALMLDETKAVKITRQTDAFTSSSSFTHTSDLSTASVAPGGFFSGSATFADGLLTGDLAVSMAGVEEPVVVPPAAANLSVGENEPPAECAPVLGE